MLSLNLAPIFKARGIERPYSFLVKAGFTYHSATNILNNNTRSIRFDHLELLCKALVCEPNDLLLYTPGSNPLPDQHPLNNLIQTHHPADIKQTFATIPYKQLKEINKQINQTL
ncbi:MAG TPA: helix-turn-helix transcriptional regulator [Chitinophagaceae bacterium]|nr:helix-turn-helix transcriptional regulator [Chitinophagaceae bacterium]